MNRISKTRIIAMLMSVAMLLTLLPVGLSAATANEWDISKSKTATNLDTDFLSQVTLSLPSAEEQLVTDVVFVLDKSTSGSIETQALSMLSDLQEKIAETNAKVKVGVVIFNYTANVFGFYDLSTQYDDIQDAIKQEIKSGTNTHSGLLAGIKMLEDDDEVDDNRKYLIFVSDGITYIFDDGQGNATSIKTIQYYWEGQEIVSSEPSVSMTGAAMKYQNEVDFIEKAGGMDAYLSSIKTFINNDGDKYWTSYKNPSDDVPSLTSNRNEIGAVTLDKEIFDTLEGVSAHFVDNHANNVDFAIYLTCEAYKQASQKYHCYAMKATSEYSSTYPWSNTFMNYLIGSEEVNFSSIQNDILYLVDNTSYVEDYIGYTADYNFDFVNDISKISLTVGGKALTITQIDDNTYGFGTFVDKVYPYELIYTYGDGKDEEHFTWKINVPVTNFDQVQLSYYVKLTNPQTEAGTYGTYDRDGSEGYAGLYTNNSAKLYPVDSNGASGTSEAFPRPTVSYTVGSISEPEPEPEPEPDEPGPIWPTFTMATVIKVDSEDENIRLSGAKFELYREGRSTPIGLNVDTTDENGELRLPSLTPGSTYYLIEVAAPEGYMLTSEPIVFTAEYDMRQNVIYVENTKSKTPSDLNSDDHFAYIVGYPDGNVRPTGNITRAEVATIFFRLLTEEVRNENMTWDNPFSDVNKGDWFDCAISTLYAMGIINGYPDGTYDPNGFITRAEFAAIAARFDTIGNDFEQSFGDVYGHWAEDEIAAAKAHGWLTGYEDGTFKPDQLITRAEAMTIVNRVLNRIPESADALLDDMVKWPDNADTSAWYYLAVQEATNSHFYDRTDSNKEIWTEIREPREWTELEK